jgi:hypothetical protein
MRSAYICCYLQLWKSKLAGLLLDLEKLLEKLVTIPILPNDLVMVLREQRKKIEALLKAPKNPAQLPALLLEN